VKGDRTSRLILAGTIGNVLEWYDFAIYGYFAVSLGRTFFPQQDPVAQVLAAFSVFAVGYVMRPLGGILTGVIGDRYGRRTALTFSVSAMAVPTFLVGVLPGYATLGIAAPILLTLLRMIQGLSVGGECTTAFTFMIERAPAGRRGLHGAIATCGITAGTLLGSGTGALMTALVPDDALQAWGWRVPFMAGLLAGVAGYLLRRHVQEATAPSRRRGSPLGNTLRHHKWLVARLAGITAFSAIGFYLMFLYVVSWLQLVDGVAPARALAITTSSMAILLMVMLAAGWMSDRVGRRTPMFAAHVLALMSALPLLWLMHHPDPRLIQLGQMGFVLILGTTMAITPVIMVEATPYEVRCTAIAIGYNTAYGVLGGLSPLGATWLVHRTDIDLSPAWIVMAAAVLSFFSLLSLNKEPAVADKAS
jgi:MHS family proline/betaine transporter-like MFS transporter